MQQEEPISVSVSQPLTVTTFRTPQVQYDNNLIEIKAEVTKSGQPIDYSAFEPEAKYIKGGVTATTSPVRTEHLTASGIYFYKYNLEGEGILRFRIKVQDSLGAWTDFTNWQEVQVCRFNAWF